jgi:predicted transcriptional regulator
MDAERAQIVSRALTEEPATVTELSSKTGLSVQTLGRTILPVMFRQGRVRLRFRTQRGQPQSLYSKPETLASQGLLAERGMEEHALIAPE